MYNELVKSLKTIREYLRWFTLEGYRVRDDYEILKTYDNSKRMAVSWIGKDLFNEEYVENGGKQKKSFGMCVDSRTIPTNPLFRVFQARSATRINVDLHFIILDILNGAEARTASEIYIQLGEYGITETVGIDTLQNKLTDYVNLGILKCTDGKPKLYSLNRDFVNTDPLRDAIRFYSETDPLGVVGSYFRIPEDSPFRYKRHFLFGVLDAEIMEDLMWCLRNRKKVCLELSAREKSGKKPDKRSDGNSGKESRTSALELQPIRIYISTQTGRQYLIAARYIQTKQNWVIEAIRLERILSVKAGEDWSDDPGIQEAYERFRRHTWGVTTYGKSTRPEHLEMEIVTEEWEGFVVERLKREARIGQVEPAGTDEAGRQIWRFSADILDTAEIRPWMRSFIGRIRKIDCGPELKKRFMEDLMKMAAKYEEDGGADE